MTLGLSLNFVMGEKNALYSVLEQRDKILKIKQCEISYIVYCLMFFSGTATVEEILEDRGKKSIYLKLIKLLYLDDIHPGRKIEDYIDIE